ncbi:FAD7 [Auxenochlorella protothecoides x Auxenochlorella symbiontica]
MVLCAGSLSCRAPPSGGARLERGSPFVRLGHHARPQARRRMSDLVIRSIAAPAPPPLRPASQPQAPPASETFTGGRELANRPPFSLQDIRNAIPAECWKKDTFKSFAYLALDVGIVAALAVTAHAVNSPWLWPFYWLAQGTMFWALFVVGHDCGHQSFSTNKQLNDVVGLIVHSSIGVPYHGWRISHRTHHNNHGHVENDESWYPPSETVFDSLSFTGKLGRFVFPISLLAYPFYLLARSPGKEGSHYSPETDLFTPREAPMIRTSNAVQLAFVGVLGACTWALGLPAMIKLYFLPYIVSVMWLDLVTYLHHHGPSNPEEEMPWYRGEEWSYMRGGLSTIDRDYGIFNKIHHDIGTHVVHHLFPQIPHYNLVKATEAVKPVLGQYYRKVEPSPGPLPVHLLEPLLRSMSKDHYVDDSGDIVFYKTSEELQHPLRTLWRKLTGGRRSVA